MRGAVVTLEGPLGAGKTTLAKGVARGLGIEQDVTSPTFSYICEYPAPIPLYHMDLYRISQVEEFELLGGCEYLEGNGVCLIEWAERIEELLPENVLRLRLEFRGEGRLLSWKGALP